MTKTNEEQNSPEIFPAFYPDLDIKRVPQLISNLEVVKDLEFSHEHINDMVERFALNPIQCNSCNDLSKVFMNPEYHYNELYVRNARWVLNKNSILSMDVEPYKSLKIPLFDIRNINFKHSKTRPRGKIHIRREISDVKDKFPFVQAARTSSTYVLKKLVGKPAISKEIAFKLSEDIDQGILLKLDDFLKLDEVKKEGINRDNVSEYVVPSPLHVVGNPGSNSSPIRLVVAPNRPNTTTRQTINQALHTGLPQLPKLQEVLLKFRFSLSFVVADLVAFYKRNVLDPHGSLMSAIYLQEGDDPRYPTLDPESTKPLQLYIMRCANFGYHDSASISCTVKNMITKFYDRHFPDCVHKVKSVDLPFLQELLEDGYSDDVLIPVFINMVDDENKNPTFVHPDNWDYMTDLERSHMLVKVIFLKLLSVIDFCDFEFKETSSLFKEIEQFLNQDARLACNKPKPPLRDIQKVKDEILGTREKFDWFKNNMPNEFPSNNNMFKFLGLLTDRQTDQMRLKGKPLSFKSKSKGNIDVVIRNSAEFYDFIQRDVFLRQHLSSLVAQAFCPLFLLIASYGNVARLIQRHILSTYNKKGVMPMSHQIDREHYSLLCKLAGFFFACQELTVPRYLLVKDVSAKNIRNVIYGFCDGSSQLSTSCIYLLSYDATSDKYSINIVSTLSKLGIITKLEGEQLEFDTVPKKEAHGLALACNGALICADMLKKLKLNHTATYIFTDAISQAIALGKSPALFPPPFNKYYSQCNTILFNLGQRTNQRKEDMVLFIDQKKYLNPADLISKFNIHHETVEMWIEKTKTLFAPDWLQRHPKEYIKTIVESSRVAIAKQAEGGVFDGHDNDKSAITMMSNVCCDFISASDPQNDVNSSLMPMGGPDYSVIGPLFSKYQDYPNDVPLRILGRTVLILHHWIDLTLIRKAKRNSNCPHKMYQCPCADNALQHIVRPYKKDPIYPPYLKNGKFNTTNEHDKRTLTQVGFYWAALICGNTKHKLHRMIGLDRYVDGRITYGTLSCKVVSGRVIRHHAVINPTRHKIFFLLPDSPLVLLAVNESHANLGCGLGVEQYIKGAQLIGVTAPAIGTVCERVRDSCPGCLQYRVFSSKRSPYCKGILKQHGPDDMLSTTVRSSPLSHIVVDETGPIFFAEGDPEKEDSYKSAHLLLCVEYVTYRTNIVIMKDMELVSIIKALETLQNLRGTLSNIVLDAHLAHVALLNDGKHDKRNILIKMLRGNTRLLNSAGITLTVAAAKRHEKCGKAEHMVKQVKRILLTVIKSYKFTDYYDMQHKVSLIQMMINERPLFLHNQRILTPHSIDFALLKRSSAPMKVYTLSDFVIPRDRDMKKLVHELTQESKLVLGLIAAETVKILNQHRLREKFAINEIVFVPDLLIAKNPHSLMDSLARVKDTIDFTTYSLTLLNKKVITRHVTQIVSTGANFNTCQFQSIDPFQINYVEEMWTPSDFKVKLRDHTLQFENDNDTHQTISSPIQSDNEQSLLYDLSAVPDRADSDIPVCDIPYVGEVEDRDTQRLLQESIDAEPILQRAGDPGQHLSLKRHKYNKTKRGFKRHKSDSFKQSLSVIPENEILPPLSVRNRVVPRDNLPSTSSDKLRRSHKQWPGRTPLTPHHSNLFGSIESRFNDKRLHQSSARTHARTQSESRTHDPDPWHPPRGYKDSVPPGTIKYDFRPRRVSHPNGAPSSSSSFL